MEHCGFCNKTFKSIKAFDKHYTTKKHIYNVFQYDLDKHLDNLIIADEIKDKNVRISFSPMEEGNEKVYKSNNRNDICEMLNYKPQKKSIKPITSFFN